MDDQRKTFAQQLREIGGSEHADHLAELRSELEREDPRPAVLEEQFERLRSHPNLGAELTAWWNDPKTQTFIAELNGMGL
jgi:hypothetical protein